MTKRIAITGATGFVGRHLSVLLAQRGHTVIPVSRRPIVGGIGWDPAQGAVEPSAFEGIDAVVHLAGEGIADRRWSAPRKRAIRESRTGPTALLARTLATLQRPPGALISMSGMGYYGDAGDRVLTEASPPGNDFLAAVCRDWEDAAAPARAAGLRVVHPRMGVVLSSEGGALPRMLLPFRLGLGGRLASGMQWMSWIALTDALAGLERCILDDTLRGPVNLTSPNPVTNATFTRTLGQVLHRPVVFRVPRLALRGLFGEMAEATLLASQRAVPAALTAAGFQFQLDTVDAALRAALPSD